MFSGLVFRLVAEKANIRGLATIVAVITLKRAVMDRVITANRRKDVSSFFEEGSTVVLLP